MHSHYENLKIARTATQAQIKAAYRKLRSRHHPDRNTDPESTHRMQIINEAWEVLSNPERRAKHDAEIARQEMFEEFFREHEEESQNTESKDDSISTADWEEENKIEARQTYFTMLGASWMRESRDSPYHSKVDPTYRVYRTDFTVGEKTYYYYACYKAEIVQKWLKVKKDLGEEAKNYSSETLSPRLANQELMDEMLRNKGVLWVEGSPRGDVTGAFFRKG
jgi:curved DNA-binding protein CbpA